MLILTNCLSERVDEGCIKVANSLIKRLRTKEPGIRILSYERRTALTDRFLSLNKLLISGALFSELHREKGPILYIPFPAKPIASMLRLFILGLQAGRPVHVLLTMTEPLNKLEALLLKMSRARLLVLSQEAKNRFAAILGEKRVCYLKTGVDTRRFCPVDPEQVIALKKKYGLDPSKKVVLHVGHLNEGRNVGALIALDPRYQAVLVTSTLTRDEQDRSLRERLLTCPHIRIFEDYLPEIQELYQLSDVYLFPVEEMGHCIDVPLSCLEAASCNKPVVTTAYGEMKSFINKEGFWQIDRFEPARLNALVEEALATKDPHTRRYALDYDWQRSIEYLIHLDNRVE